VSEALTFDEIRKEIETRWNGTTEYERRYREALVGLVSRVRINTRRTMVHDDRFKAENAQERLTELEDRVQALEDQERRHSAHPEHPADYAYEPCGGVPESREVLLKTAEVRDAPGEVSQAGLDALADANGEDAARELGAILATHAVGRLRPAHMPVLQRSHEIAERAREQLEWIGNEEVPAWPAHAVVRMLRYVLDGEEE